MKWSVTAMIGGVTQNKCVEDAVDVYNAIQRCSFAAKSIISCVRIDEESLDSDKTHPIPYRCHLKSVDFAESLAEISIPVEILEKSFHAGTVVVDFSGVQNGSNDA